MGVNKTTRCDACPLKARVLPTNGKDGGGCDVYDGWATQHTWRDWSDQMNKMRSDIPPNMVSGISLISQRNWEWNLITEWTLK